MKSARVRRPEHLGEVKQDAHRTGEDLLAFHFSPVIFHLSLLRLCDLHENLHTIRDF
jgi:hypothetical protein